MALNNVQIILPKHYTKYTNLFQCSDKPENQQVENLMCENKLLRDELAKSKEAIEILKASKTDGCLSEKQCKQLEQEMTVVHQIYSIDLGNFAEPCEDNRSAAPLARFSLIG